MARDRIWGAEMGDLSDVHTTSGTLSIVSSPLIGGAYSLRVNPTTTDTGYAWISGFTTTGALTPGTAIATATKWCKFNFRYATKPASGAEEICAPANGAGSYKIAIRLTSTGTLNLYDSDDTLLGTGSTVLAVNTAYRLEVKCGTDSEAGINDTAYELKIDGVSEYSGTNANGTTSLTAGINLGKVVNRSSQSVDYFYDDVVIDDADYPGASTIEIMQPDGAGTYSGATAGTFADVDEIPHDSDTTFLSWTSNTARHSVTLESAAAAGISGTIKSVQGYGIGRDLGTGRNLILFQRSGSTDTDSGSGYDVGMTYEFFGGKCFETDPADAGAWTTGKLDALEVGTYINTSSAIEIRVTAMGVVVEFLPPPPGGVALSEESLLYQSRINW